LKALLKWAKKCIKPAMKHAKIILIPIFLSFIASSVSLANLTTPAKNNLRGNHKLIDGYGKLDVAKTINKLQKKYKNTNSFTSQFEQNFHPAMLNKTAHSSGQVLFKKPGQMRWNYKAPNKKAFIINNSSLIVYNAKDKSAYQNKCFKQNSLTSSLSFLWGMGDLNKKFDAKEFNGRFGDKTDLHIRFKPKEKNSHFRKLILVLDPKSYQIKQSIIVDWQNNINQFIYSDFKTNPQLPKNIFNFKTPENITLMPMPGTCLDAEKPKDTPDVKPKKPDQTPHLRGAIKSKSKS